jgi:hypothetical protein
MVDIDPTQGIAGAGLGFDIAGGGQGTSAYDIYSQKTREAAIKPLDPFAETNPFGTTNYKPEETAEGILGGTAETAAYVQAVQDLNRFVEENIAKGVDPTRPDVRNKDTLIANSIYRGRLSRVKELAYRLQSQQTLETQRLKGVMEGTILPSSRERKDSDYFRAPEAPDMRVYEEALPGQLDPQVGVFNRAHAQMTYETPEAYKTMQKEEEQLKTYLRQKYEQLLQSGRPKEEVEMWYQNQINGIQGAAYEPKQASHIIHHSQGGGKGSGSDDDSYIFDDIHEDLVNSIKNYNVSSVVSDDPNLWENSLKSTRLVTVSQEDKVSVSLGARDKVARYETPIFGVTSSLNPSKARIVVPKKTDISLQNGIDQGMFSTSTAPQTDEAMRQSSADLGRDEGAGGDTKYTAPLQAIYTFRERGSNMVRLVYNYKGRTVYEDYNLDKQGTRENLNKIFSGAQKFGQAEDTPQNTNNNPVINSSDPAGLFP